MAGENWGKTWGIDQGTIRNIKSVKIERRSPDRAGLASVTAQKITDLEII